MVSFRIMPINDVGMIGSLSKLKVDTVEFTN